MAQNNGSQRSLSLALRPARCGIDDENGVKLKTDRPRFDATDTGQKRGGE